LKKYETEVENITKQLSNMNYEDGSFEEMEENYRNVKHETNSIKTQVDTMGARYPWLDFRYSGNKIIEISNFPAKTFPRISKDNPKAKTPRTISCKIL
jgi:hypothetical protein